MRSWIGGEAPWTSRRRKAAILRRRGRLESPCASPATTARGTRALCVLEVAGWPSSSCASEQLERLGALLGVIGQRWQDDEASELSGQMEEVGAGCQGAPQMTRQKDSSVRTTMGV
jgi:hypothetical protein